MKYYDIHTHLNYEPLSKNADHIANVCKQKNILLNNIGTNLKSSQSSIALANKHDNVFACVGIHPNDVNENSLDECVKQLEE
jgi:TatD DNase family protein